MRTSGVGTARGGTSGVGTSGPATPGGGGAQAAGTSEVRPSGRTAGRTNGGGTDTTDRRRTGPPSTRGAVAAPGRRAPARDRPPGRRDQRRPTAPHGRPVRTAAARPGTPAIPVAASGHRLQALRNLPRYWFAERLLLTLSGQRPVHWMLGHTQGPAYDQLAALAPGAPLRPVLPGAAAPVLRRCDEFRPRPDVIEAFARIAVRDRLAALAFRLEQGADRRWRCTAVELAPRPAAS